MHTTTSNPAHHPSVVCAQHTPISPSSGPSKSCNLKQVARQLAPRNQQKPCVCIPLCGKTADEIQTPSDDYTHEIQTYTRYLPFFQHAYLVHTSTLNRYHYFILWLADLAETGKLQDDAFNTLLPKSELERFLDATSIEEELACLGDAYKHDYQRIYQALVYNESLWNDNFQQWFTDHETPCSTISWHTVYPETPNNCPPHLFLRTLGLNNHYRSKFQKRMDESIKKYFTPDSKGNTNPKGKLYHQPFPYRPELTPSAEKNKRYKQTVLYTLSLKHNRISSLFIHDFIHGNFKFIDKSKPILLMSGHLNMYLRTLFHNAQHVPFPNSIPHDLPTYFDPMDTFIPPATEETITRIHALHAKQPLNASMKLAHTLREHCPVLTDQAIQDVVAMLLILSNHDTSRQQHLTSAMIKHFQRMVKSPLKTASPDNPSIAPSYSMHAIAKHDQPVLHSPDLGTHQEAYPSFFGGYFKPQRPPQTQATPSPHRNRATSQSSKTRPIAYATCVLIAGLSLFCAHALQTDQTQRSTNKSPVRKRFY